MNIIPNKLNKKRQTAVMDPLLTALIAMRMGRATSEHYHELAGALTIAPYIAQMVARHRHLSEELQPAIDALNAIYRRHEQRTVPDAPWNGTAEEIDLVEHGINIYLAMIKATPGPKVLQAIKKAMRESLNIETSKLK